MRLRRFVAVLGFLIAVIAVPAEARLGLTLEEWEKRFGKPDARNYYRWEGPGGRVRGGPFLVAIKVEENRVTGIRLRSEAEVRLLAPTRLGLIFALRQSDDQAVRPLDQLSEDGRTLTLLLPKLPPPANTPGEKLEGMMGKFTNDWIKALGKPDDKGFYRCGPYRLQTATNRNSGKVDWIKVVKVSGEAFTEEEAGQLYESLTGRQRDSVSNPPELFKEGTLLLMMKPKK